MIETMCIKIYS